MLEAVRVAIGKSVVQVHQQFNDWDFCLGEYRALYHPLHFLELGAEGLEELGHRQLVWDLQSLKENINI